MTRWAKNFAYHLAETYGPRSKPQGISITSAAALITEPTFLRTFIYLYPVHLEIVEHPPILYKC